MAAPVSMHKAYHCIESGPISIKVLKLGNNLMILVYYDQYF